MIKMLSDRTERILQFIVGQYIASAMPVSSQCVTDNCELGVSSATVRNEMASLEREAYIVRPHPSAGSVPSDKGYRRYVQSLGDVKLPVAEQRMVSHVFHQVERRLDQWVNLAATLIAQMVQNVAVVTVLKSDACRFKHMELVSLKDSLTLAVFVLNGAKVRQQLVAFVRPMPQSELTAIAGEFTARCQGLTRSQISNKRAGLSSVQLQIVDCLTKLMEAEDNQEYEEQYLDGLHFTLSQPEFAGNQRMSVLMELVEQRSLLKSILPPGLPSRGITIVIGEENKAEVIRDYSVVIGHYGLPEEAVGTIGVIGPTRMSYARAIAVVEYLSLVLSGMAAWLYGRDTPAESDRNSTN